MRKENKIWRCETCAEYIKEEDILTAVSPFDPDSTITGCPNCKSATGDGDGWQEICEIEGCNKPATCGTPVPNEPYLRSCFNHYKEVGGEI